MKPPPDPHYRHRFSAEIISYAVWLYHVFSLSLRDVELLLAERGILVSYGEYSIMERAFEEEVLPLCHDSNIGFVAFSPMASGFRSGKVRAGDKYEGDDVRRVITRFDNRNIEANQPLLDLLHRFADEKGVTLAQVSLAWMLAKWPLVTPIPGSRKIERIDENLGAADVDLTADELA